MPSELTQTKEPRGGGLRRVVGAAFRVSSVYVGLLVLSIVLSFVSPFFLTVANLMNVVMQAAAGSIVAVGLTVVLITGEIDLSIGSLIGMTGSVAAVLVIKEGCPVGIGMLAGLLAGVVAGLLNGLTTVIFRIPSFIVTLAMLGIAHGIGLLLTNGRPVVGFPPLYSIIGQGSIGPVPVPAIVALTLYVIIHLILTRTRFGIEVYASGGGRRAAEMAGVRVNRVIIAAFALSGACGGIAGLVLSSRLNAGDGNFGASSLIDAVAATVVGGTSLMGGAGSAVGTLGGVLIIAVIRNGLILLDVQAFWQEVAVGFMIVLAVVINEIARGELHLASIRRSLNR